MNSEKIQQASQRYREELEENLIKIKKLSNETGIPMEMINQIKDYMKYKYPSLLLEDRIIEMLEVFTK